VGKQAGQRAEPPEKVFMDVKKASYALVFDELVQKLVALRHQGVLKLHHEPLCHAPTQNVHPVKGMIDLGERTGVNNWYGMFASPPFTTSS